MVCFVFRMPFPHERSLHSQGRWWSAHQKVPRRSCRQYAIIIHSFICSIDYRYLYRLTEGLSTLAGHRTVGGCRASLYNGMPVEGVEKLCDHMKEFQEKYSGE